MIPARTLSWPHLHNRVCYSDGEQLEFLWLNQLGLMNVTVGVGIQQKTQRHVIFDWKINEIYRNPPRR